MELGLGYRLLSALGSLPRFRGKQRLGRRISALLGDRTDVLLSAKDGHRFLVPSLKEPISLELMIHGEYEAETLALLKRDLRPGDCVIDVGANIGAFALPASRLICPTGRLFAFEASARVFPYLKSNLERNGSTNAIAIHAAAGAQDTGTLTFFDAPVEKFGMGSRAHWDGQSGYAVPARSVDSVLREYAASGNCIRLLKIDVEGFELDVLRGATALLGNGNPPLVVFEFNDWAERRAGYQPGDAQRYLADAGFRLYTLGAYLAGRGESAATVTEGGAMLVAVKP